VRAVTRYWVVLAAAVVALAGVVALARDDGRGGGSGGGSEEARIKEAVHEFAGASDARACDFLTDKALERLYRGRAGCIRRSPRFESGAVEVEDVHVREDGSAIAKTTSLDGERRYEVELTRVGCARGLPAGSWCIDEVRRR
jgi:hypothetical protein